MITYHTDYFKRKIDVFRDPVTVSAVPGAARRKSEAFARAAIFSKKVLTIRIFRL